MDNQGVQTPLRCTIRKQDDRSSCSDLDSPEMSKKPCIDSVELTKLKGWFREQLLIIRSDIKAENAELRQEITNLNTKIETKDKILTDLENNVLVLSNELQKTNGLLNMAKYIISKLENDLMICSNTLGEPH
jgi:hypothetical protein